MLICYIYIYVCAPALGLGLLYMASSVYNVLYVDCLQCCSVAVKTEFYPLAASFLSRCIWLIVVSVNRIFKYCWTDKLEYSASCIYRIGTKQNNKSALE